MLEADSTTGLKEEVESVLRLPSLARGKEDLDHISSVVSARIKKDRSGRRMAAKADKEAGELAVSIARNNAHLDNLQGRQKKMLETIEEINEKISKDAEVKVLADKLNEVRASLSAARESLERSSSRRVRELSGAWKILMWKKLGGIYDEYDDQIDRANQASYEIKSLEKAISRREAEISDFEDTCSECGQTIPDVEDHLRRMRDSLDSDRNELESLRTGGNMSSDDLTVALARLLKIRPQGGDLERAIEAEDDWSSDLSRVRNLEEEEARLSKRVGDEAVAKMGSLGEEKGRMELAESNMRVRIREAKDHGYEMEKELSRLESIGAVSDRGKSLDSEVFDEIGRISQTIEETISEYREKAGKGARGLHGGLHGGNQREGHIQRNQGRQGLQGVNHAQVGKGGDGTLQRHEEHDDRQHNRRVEKGLRPEGTDILRYPRQVIGRGAQAGAARVLLEGPRGPVPHIRTQRGVPDREDDGGLRGQDSEVLAAHLARGPQVMPRVQLRVHPPQQGGGGGRVHGGGLRPLLGHDDRA